LAGLGSVNNRSGPGPGFRPGPILAFICLGQFMVFLDVSIVNLALPSIQSGLKMPDVSPNHVVTTDSTVLGGFLQPSGRLADTFGRRRMLQAGLRPVRLGIRCLGPRPGALDGAGRGHGDSSQPFSAGLRPGRRA